MTTEEKKAELHEKCVELAFRNIMLSPHMNDEQLMNLFDEVDEFYLDLVKFLPEETELIETIRTIIGAQEAHKRVVAARRLGT